MFSYISIRKRQRYQKKNKQRTLKGNSHTQKQKYKLIYKNCLNSIGTNVRKVKIIDFISLSNLETFLKIPTVGEDWVLIL